MKSNLLLSLLFAFSLVQINSQTLVFPLSNGGDKDQGAVFKYDITNGNHEALFFDHEIEKTDHENSGTTNRKSKGVYVNGSNSIYYTFAAGGRHTYDATANGQIVKYNLTTQEFFLVRSFSLLNDGEGTHPTNELTEYNNKLYGVCRSGGNNNDGVIFYIDLADDSYNVVYHFNEATDGATPSSALILENNKFYGGTAQSTDGEGHVLFEFDPSNNNYTVLHDRTGWGKLETVTDVIFRSGLLYFCTDLLVGYYNFNTDTVTTLHQSSGTNDVLGNFYSGFNFSSNVGKYFVTANSGGSSGKGAILELNGSSPFLVNVHSFGANGTLPKQELIDLGNGKQAGVTLENATNINGSLFEFTATNIEQPIFSFPNQNTDGFRLTGIPVLANNVLYGFADEGGANGTGVFYKYDLVSGTYSKVKDLGSIIGRAPIGELTAMGNGNYIGLNAAGSGKGYGAIFSTDLTNITPLYNNINNSILERFETNLVSYNGLYYGVGLAFNANSLQSFSVLYSYDTNTNSIAQVAAIDVSGVPNVALPNSISQGNIMLEGDKIYGFTKSKIFEYNLTTSTLSNVYTFNTSVDGTSTLKSFINNGVIYGVNFESGTNNSGSIFKFDTSTTTFTVLEDFTASTGGPINIGKSGDFLYGFTSKGGANNVGSIFKYDLINNTYSSFYDLQLTDGYYRGAQLFLASDNNMYATFDAGGQNGFGSIVKIDLSNDSVSFPFHFTNTTGNTTLRAMISENSSTLSTESEVLSQLKVYPNPVEDILHINTENVINIRLYNILGKELVVKITDKTINMSSLKPGFYSLQVETNNGSFSKKIIKK